MRVQASWLFLAAWLASHPAQAGAPVEAGKVFAGREGLSVAIVPLQPRDQKKVLIRITGSDTELDGKVLLYELTGGDGDDPADRAPHRAPRHPVTGSDGGGVPDLGAHRVAPTLGPA